MKRKPNKPRPEPWAQTGRTDPGGGAADPGGSAFGAGSEKQSGPGEAGTSGQSVPKSPKSKFRQKSQQEQAAASKLRMEKQGRKVEKAKEKLARQKPPKKPGPVKRAGRVASGSVHGFLHGKIFEVEQENVGTEGAHHAELAGETAGTGFLGGLAAYPLALAFLDPAVIPAAFYGYVVPFLISTVGGSILAGVLVFTLQKSGALNAMRGALEH